MNIRDNLWREEEMGELVKANEEKKLSEEKDLFSLWDVLYKPHSNHKTNIQSWDMKCEKRENRINVRKNHQPEVADETQRERNRETWSNQTTEDKLAVVSPHTQLSP